MLRIAITGGIGSGKSAACSYLEELGYTVIYADKMARAITAAGGKAIPYIREHFGDEYICADGSMNRALIRELVYRDPEAKRILEEGTTKVVIQDIETIIKEGEEQGLKVMFFEIPLLFETNSQDDYDSCWVVHADLKTRIARVQARDGLSREQVELIIENQINDKKRLALADEIIYNNKGREEIKRQLEELLDKYKIK
ncbi:MAG: dephospho-CoA kinase [Firmicutes bacterium]|nr:dephospho-CoA kinase [Bacillota bacterium]